MELETYIQIHLNYEKSRLERNPSASERAKIGISTVESAPRSVDAIQSLLDAKEVAMNKTDNPAELQLLDRQWSALFWLQSTINQTNKGRLREAV